MKRIPLYILIVLGAAACNITEKEKFEVKTVSFTAVTESGGGTAGSASDATKTTLSNLDVVWTAGDAIKVYSATSTSGAKFDLTSEAGLASGTFSGPSVGNGPYYAFYPYSDSYSGTMSGTQISVTIPASQTYGSGTSFATCTNPAVGKTDGSNFTFKNLCGILELKLTGTYSITKIELTALGETNYLNGPGSVDMAYTTEPVFTFANGLTEASKTLTLNCPTPVQLSDSPQIFHLIVPPGQLSGGFRIKIYDNNGGSMTKTKSSAVTISRSVISPMTTLAYVRTDSPFMSTAEYGIYDIDESDGAVTAVRQFNAAAGDQYGATVSSAAVNNRTFRIQNLSTAETAGLLTLTYTPQTLAIGSTYTFQSSTQGAFTLTQQINTTAKLIKAEGSKLWFEDSTNGKGFIVDSYEDDPLGQNNN